MTALLEEENLRKAFQMCLSYGLEFAFYKKVLIKGKTLKLWSQAVFFFKTVYIYFGTTQEEY